MNMNLDLWELPIFRNDGLTEKITARERVGLTDDAKRRWDYFFRATAADLDDFFSKDYADAMQKRAAALSAWDQGFQKESGDARGTYSTLRTSRDERFKRESADAQRSLSESERTRDDCVDRFKRAGKETMRRTLSAAARRDKLFVFLYAVLACVGVLTLVMMFRVSGIFFILGLVGAGFVLHRFAPIMKRVQGDVNNADETLKIVREAVEAAKKAGIGGMLDGLTRGTDSEISAPPLTGAKKVLFDLSGAIYQLYPLASDRASEGDGWQEEQNTLRNASGEFQRLQRDVERAKETLGKIKSTIARLEAGNSSDADLPPRGSDLRGIIEGLIQAQANVTEAKNKVEAIDAMSGVFKEKGISALLSDPWRARFGSYFPDLLRLGISLGDAETELATAKKRISDLKAQIPSDIPTDSEMKEFIDKMLAGVETAAKKQLRLGTGEVTVEKDIPPIVEWGKLQADRPGYTSFNPVDDKGARRDNALGTHLPAYRLTADQTLIYAVHYAQYLFPTRDYIAVHGQFVDCVLNETRGRLTDEYYYADVTSVRTEMKEIDMFGKYMEATTFCLTVSSGDKVAVTFLDEALQESMRKKIAEDKAKRVKQLQELELKLKDAPEEQRARIRSEMESVRKEHDKLITVEKTSVANQVVQDIRHQLRQKKTAASA